MIFIKYEITNGSRFVIPISEITDIFKDTEFEEKIQKNRYANYATLAALANDMCGIPDVKLVRFVNEIFVENTTNISERSISRESGVYKIGQLIQAGNGPVFYGLVEFFLTSFDGCLVGLKLNNEQIQENTEIVAKIIFKAPLFKRSEFGIIVKVKETKKLKAEVELMKTLRIVNSKCIKYKERYNIATFEIGDIVKYNSGEYDAYFRVHNIWLLNRVPCVEVSKATWLDTNSSTMYVLLGDIIKHDSSVPQTIYFQDTIIDYRSVLIWDKLNLVNVHVNDKVEFKIEKTDERCKGIINYTGNANGIPSCVVQLSRNFDKVDEYEINEENKFFNCKNIDSSMVIVPADILQKIKEIATTSGIPVILPETVKTVNGKKFDEKYIAFKSNNKRHFVFLKWKGVINGIYCFGGEIDNEDHFGTNGTFAGQELFKCREKCGVLIPSDEVTDCCLNNKHKTISKNRKYLSLIWLGIRTVKAECVCCAESMKNIKKCPKLEINGKVKYGYKSGTCRWIGLLNGIEAVGVEMDKEFSECTNGQFDGLDLFACDPEKGCLFSAEDIIHDVEAEKLHFVVDEVVDIERIHSLKNLNNFAEVPFKIGDPVLTVINKIDYIGELKWGGQINNKSCVGLDLEVAFEHGMNGRICGQTIFQCPEGHGLITPLAKIQNFDVANKLQQYENGLINPNKYIKFEEKYDRRFLDERKINKNGLVFVTVSDENEQTRYKGTLKWCGLMNDIPVGAVELNHDNFRGTDGTFWRQRLFQCGQKRAVAVLWNRITQYIPYETRPIPEENKIFHDFNINTAVKYFHTIADVVNDLYGAVRWTGVDETGEYLFGIELEVVTPGGTDGEFLGQRLFNCAVGKGILAPLDLVTKDLRLMEEDLSHEDCPLNMPGSRPLFEDRHYRDMTKYDVMEKYFMELVSGNTNQTLKSEIISHFIKNDQIDMIHGFIEYNINNSMNMEIYPDLLLFLIRKEEFDMVKNVLKLVNITDEINPNLLFVANEALKKNQWEIFQLSLDKCSDKNVLLENRETFLTNLFKENYSELEINNVLDKDIFNPEIPNENGESPLLLACKLVMVSSVEKLLSNRILSMSQKKEAINRTIYNEGECSPSVGRSEDILRIVALINNSKTLDSRECTICCDKTINVAFQCGHASCDSCRDKMDTCPICKTDIGVAIKLYQ